MAAAAAAAAAEVAAWLPRWIDVRPVVLVVCWDTTAAPIPVPELVDALPIVIAFALGIGGTLAPDAEATASSNEGDTTRSGASSKLRERAEGFVEVCANNLRMR